MLTIINILFSLHKHEFSVIRDCQRKAKNAWCAKHVHIFVYPLEFLSHVRGLLFTWWSLGSKKRTGLHEVMSVLDSFAFRASLFLPIRNIHSFICWGSFPPSCKYTQFPLKISLPWRDVNHILSNLTRVIWSGSGQTTSVLSKYYKRRASLSLCRYNI